MARLSRVPTRLRLVTLAPAIALLVGVGGSVFANNLQREAAISERAQRFGDETDQLVSRIEAAVEQSSRLADSVAAEAAPEPGTGVRATPTEFNTFTAGLVLDSRFPGTFGIAWADSVPKARLEQYLADPSLPVSKFADLGPEESTELATIVTLAEPESTMSVARGVDARIFPEISEALDASVESASNVATAPLPLPLRVGPDTGAPPIVVFIAHPTFRASPSADVLERIAEVIGWSAVALDTAPFIQRAGGSLGERYSMTISDVGTPDIEIGQRSADPAVGGQHRSVERQVLGRTWKFDISEAAGVLYGDAEPSNWLLWSGLMITLGAFVIVSLLTGAEHRAQRRVDRATAELAYRATHDALTGLVNRLELQDQIHAALADKESAHAVAVLYLDLDRFKLINDSLGHATGDKLLVDVAARLRTTCDDDDVVARIGGDEFVILTRCLGRSDAERLANEIETALAEPFDLAGQEHFARASIGIAVAGVDATAESLLQHADAAMYSAKHGERRRVTSFTPDLLARADDRLQIINDLRRAIDGEQFVLGFQPVLRIGSNEVVGYESLVRWDHPERGRLLPAAFLPIAYDTGLITEIDQWVRTAAFTEAARWQRGGALPTVAAQRGSSGPPWIAVNMAARELSDPGFADAMLATVATAGLDPKRLVLEVTETDLARDAGLATTQLNALRTEGIRIAVDDFGTGYSGLGNLRSLAVDILKIDRSLVEHSPDDPADRAVLKAVVDLSRALGLGIIAEGVETSAQLRVLIDLGCHHAQGWYFGQEMTSVEAGIGVMSSTPLPPRRQPVTH